MTSSTQKIGSQAEQYAEHYLQEQGLKFVTRNYRCRYGEIDLIMQDQESIVFVEVRYRDKETHGSGVETITRSKKSKLLKTATVYLIEQKLWEKIPCRFDVISLASPNQEILWIKDAFGVQYR